MAKITDLANDVTTFLNGKTFSPAVTFERAVFGAFEVESLASPVGRVWWGQRQKAASTRKGGVDRTYGVFVTIQQAVPPKGAVAIVDTLADLCESIEDELEGEAMAGLSPVTPDVSVFDDAQFLTDQLQRNNTYHNVLTLAYRDINRRAS